MMKKIIAMLFGVLLFTSCLKEEIPFQYTIRVYVTDYEGASIESADVTLKYLKNGRADYPSIYSNTGKYYEFTGLIDSGAYQIWVQKKGNIYQDNHKDATLSEDKVTSVTIKLEEF